MAAGAGADTVSSHPSPGRGLVRLDALLLALAGGAAAWVAQLLIDYALASSTCAPRGQPGTGVLPGWHGIWYGLLAINLVAIAVALVAAAASYRHWRATRHERPGQSHHALEAGEGRTRFLALLGIMAGLGFCAAIGFDTVVLLVVPQCAG